jgi:hypothetical protein
VTFTLLGVLASVAGLLFLARFVALKAEPERVSDRGADAVVEFDRFSALLERGAAGEHLSVSLRLRTNVEEGLPCYAFIVARSDGASPRQWSIWPPQPSGAVITAGGHFHGSDPTAGFSMSLTDAWQRITATVPSPSGSPPFDTVVVYVLDPRGKVLLARPFRV